MSAESTKRLDKSFKLVNDHSDLEPGKFYTVNKDGTFMKREDGIESLPSHKSVSEEDLKQIVTKSKLNKFLSVIFSTPGLITILIVIIIIGIFLGLLPLLLAKSQQKEPNTTKLEVILNSTLIETTQLSTSYITSEQTTQTITNKIESTKAQTSLESTSLLTTTNEETTTESKTTTIKVTTEELTSTLELTTSTQTTLITTTQTTIQTTVKTCIEVENPKSLIPSSYNLNSCPNNSIYTPSYLSLENSYNFGYPILQSVVCVGTVFELRCPLTQLIHIYSAYYGIQTGTNTMLCASSSSLQDVCYFDLTYSNVTSLCEGKNNCVMTANVGVFGDPCVNSRNKQLFVQYQCVDSNALVQINSCLKNTNKSSICPSLTSNQQYESYWCQSQNFNLSCSAGSVLNIICAFYGIDPNIRCANYFYYGSPTTCYSKESYDLVANKCNGKTNCTFEGDFEEDIGLNNVCPGFQNTLLIQWECVAPLVTTIQSQTTEVKLPFCDTYKAPNGTCVSSSSSIFSPYEPTYLTNSTNTYFSYPIYQQIVCANTNSYLIIACPLNMLIHIYSAYFGIQANTVSSCTSFQTTTPEKCYVSDSYDKINTACESKNSCKIRATANTLGMGNLCSDYPRQLFVQYQCVDKQTLNSSINQCSVEKSVPLICPAVNDSRIRESVVCEYSKMSLSCEGNTKINIICAYFGIHPSIKSCNIQSLTNKPVCYFRSSNTRVRTECNNRNSCEINAFTSTFGTDPCKGFDKALYVQWSCI